MTDLHLIYIPGLGDDNGQRRAVGSWRWWGVEAETFDSNWADQEPWKVKFKRLSERIDSLAEQGKSVALVGASAGAAAAISAYAAHKHQVVGVVLLAGKANRPETIGERYSRPNPALIPAVEASKKALTMLDAADRRRILSRYALWDETVHKADSRIPGARNRLSPTIGHVPTITLQIIFGAPSFIRFLKRRQANIK